MLSQFNIGMISTYQLKSVCESRLKKSNSDNNFLFIKVKIIICVFKFSVQQFFCRNLLIQIHSNNTYAIFFLG